MSTPAKIINQNLPAVALVGRVNVGKSTLFNKIIEQDLALVSSIPGTTRTRNVADAVWRGKNFRLIDTGGITFDQSVPLENDIIKQTEIALGEADIIILVTDIQGGLLPQEKELARRLRKLVGKNRKPILLVANKADTAELRLRAHDQEWRKLGLGEPFPVSATNGANLGDLLDALYVIFNKLPRRPKKIIALAPIKVSIVGKPNVGKSSLFNKLIGEERVIVNSMPHTTREPHDTLVEYEKYPILFVDTAGIRRKAKVSGELEKIGIQKSLKTIGRSAIVLFLLDAAEPITDQDQQLGGLLREHAKSVIIVVNKWDLAEDNSDSFRNEVKNSIYQKFPHLDFAPIVFVSAKSGYRVHQIFPLIVKAAAARQTAVADDALAEFFRQSVLRHRPTRGKGVRHPKLLGLRQLAADPPVFEILIKAKTSVHGSYLHYLENRLREQFEFFAAPIIMKISKMKQ